MIMLQKTKMDANDLDESSWYELTLDEVYEDILEGQEWVWSIHQNGFDFDYTFIESIKEYFYHKKIDKLKLLSENIINGESVEDYQEDVGTNFLTVAYKKIEIDNDSKFKNNENWKVEIYCTSNQFKHCGDENLETFFQNYWSFNSPFSRYSEDDYNIEIKIFGTIFNGEIKFDKSILEKWEERGVKMTLYGFDEEANLISYSL